MAPTTVSGCPGPRVGRDVQLIGGYMKVGLGGSCW